jgi:hypothetical protein
MSRTVQHIIGAILLVFLTGLPVLALLCAPMCDSTPVSAASNTSAATPAHAGCHDAAPETDSSARISGARACRMHDGMPAAATSLTTRSETRLLVAVESHLLPVAVAPGFISRAASARLQPPTAHRRPVFSLRI